MAKDNTRVTVEIPTVDHKKLKMLAAFHGKSMREIFVELIESGLEQYKECQQDHTPNKVTQEALKKAQSLRGTKKAKTVADLFKQLSE